jgi:hypothetical protein
MGTVGGISYSGFNLTKKQSINPDMPDPSFIMQKWLSHDTFHPSTPAKKIRFSGTESLCKEQCIGNGCKRVFELIKKGDLEKLKKEYGKHHWSLGDMHIGQDEQYSLMHVAAYFPSKKTAEIMQWLSDNGVPTNASAIPKEQDKPRHWDFGDSSKRMEKPIHLAVDNANVDGVRWLLENNGKGNLEAWDVNDLTPILRAFYKKAHNKSWNIIWFLAGEGASIYASAELTNFKGVRNLIDKAGYVRQLKTIETIYAEKDPDKRRKLAASFMTFDKENSETKKESFFSSMFRTRLSLKSSYKQNQNLGSEVINEPNLSELIKGEASFLPSDKKNLGAEHEISMNPAN